MPAGSGLPDAHVHVFGPELAAAQAPPLRDRIRYLKEQWSAAEVGRYRRRRRLSSLSRASE